MARSSTTACQLNPKGLNYNANMSFQGVSKSWMTAPRQCNPNPSSHPWLAISQSNGHHNKNHDQYHFNNIPNPTIPCLIIPRAILTPDFYTCSLQNWQTTPFFWNPKKQHQNSSHHLVGSTNGLLTAKASHNPLQYCVCGTQLRASSWTYHSGMPMFHLNVQPLTLMVTHSQYEPSSFLVLQDTRRH
ncbi:PREDICTED: PRUPE_8G073600 [Prunus dulcis]|uniref:PREDICTED: PRUPE_8G073600 n=1 Tax=Prunus dulcis TaxID=3755 RepID=A0A5E4ESQ0_PRUDU|nr:PREDICTED: PRUPE_8G073600 [Prunus dulcis]